MARLSSFAVDTSSRSRDGAATARHGGRGTRTLLSHELILIFLGGVIGTGHHINWVGGPGLWVAMGTMFSFIEVLPLVLLILGGDAPAPPNQPSSRIQIRLYLHHRRCFLELCRRASSAAHAQRR